MFRRIFLPCLSLALFAAAADKPNFSGTWHLHEGKSDVTHSHTVKKVQQSDAEITINETNLKLDGKANANGVSAKLDGGALVIRTKHEKMSMEDKMVVRVACSTIDKERAGFSDHISSACKAAGL